MTVGEKIRRERERQGITQIQLAKKAGLAPQTVSNLEVDYRDIRLSTFVCLAKALGVSADALMPD